MRRAAPAIAVVIPTRDRPRTLARAVRSALQPGVGEVIVVDDGSEPPVRRESLPPDARVRLLRRGGRGVSAARNAGVEATGARHLAFLDDDDRLMPLAGLVLRRWLAAAARAGRAEAGVIVGGVVEERPGRRPRLRRPPSSGAGEIWGLDRHLLAGGRDFATKQGALIPRALLDRAGGWDEGLGSRVTSELFLRLTAIAPVEGRAWPVYRLDRGPHDKLTADPARRERSAAYIRGKHAALLAEPARRAAFEENHDAMMARTAAGRGARAPGGKAA